MTIYVKGMSEAELNDEIKSITEKNVGITRGTLAGDYAEYDIDDSGVGVGGLVLIENLMKREGFKVKGT